MPSPGTISRNLTAPTIRQAAGTDARPSFSGTGTTNANLGMPDAGHMDVARNTGNRYFNLPSGNQHYMPAREGSNRFEISERWLQTPGLNANSDASSADTYNTAQAQLIIDRNRNFEVLGTNATSALVTFADGGGITCTTAGASNDQILILPHLNTKATAWATAKWNTLDCVSYETTLTSAATITSQKVFAGLKLTNTPLTATDDDQCYFLYDTGNTNAVTAANFQLCTSRAGVDTVIDSGVAIVASTTYNLRIQIDPNRVPWFFINDQLVGFGNVAYSAALTVSAAQLTTNIDLIPYFGVQALTAAARAVTNRFLQVSKLYND